MTKEYLFLSFVFFTLGFFCLIGFISFFLAFYFKSKNYAYYFFYVISTVVFITTVLVTKGELLDKNTVIFKFLELIYKPIQILIFYLHNLFIYNTILKENIKYNRFSWLIKGYTVLVIILIAISIIYPNPVVINSLLFIPSRVIILIISFVIYYWLCKELSNYYLRYIFLACSVFLLFGFIALWDATINKDHSIYKGFQYICLGYVLENLCFAAAFIYQIITVDKKKKIDDINFEKKLLSVQIEIQSETMQHIGREIHDNIGQKLTLASLYTQQLAYENKAPQVNESIENISAIINQSLAELRELSKSLTDDTINDSTIVGLLQHESDKINSLGKCNVVFNYNDEKIEANYQMKSVSLRISQEFIQNSIKHSKCKNITIELKKFENELKLILADDGSGFDTNIISSKGIGLSNMKKRTEIIGGTFSLLSTLKKGTQLTISIPI